MSRLSCSWILALDQFAIMNFRSKCPLEGSIAGPDNQSLYIPLHSEQTSNATSFNAIGLPSTDFVHGCIVLERFCNEGLPWTRMGMCKATSSTWGGRLMNHISVVLRVHTAQKFAVRSSVLAVTAGIYEWIHNTGCPCQDWCHHMNGWVADLKQTVGSLGLY